MKNYYACIKRYCLVAALLMISVIVVQGQNLAFQVVSYDCNTGVLRYQFTSSSSASVNVSMPGVFAGTMNPNTVASHTFPADGRTGRTINGSATQSGSTVNVNYTNGCNGGSNPTQPTNPTTNPPSNGGLAFQVVSYDCNTGVLRYQFTSSSSASVNVSMPGVFAGTMNPNTVASHTFPADGRTGRTINGSATQSGSTININFTNGCNTGTNPPTNPNPTTNPYPIPSAPGNFVGHFDGASCTKVAGWIANMNDKSRPAKFDVYFNGWLVARDQPTTKVRQDAANHIGATGFNQFGFEFSIPSRYLTGSPLTISIKYAGTNTHVYGSPKTTATCQGVSTNSDCDENIARTIPRGEQAISTAYKPRTGLITLRLSSNKVPSLTSKLIPVKKGELFRFGAYAFAPNLKKRSLTPQLTTALVGGAVTGLMVMQANGRSGEKGRAIRSLPAAGVSTLTLAPLIKSLLSNRLPKAAVLLAYYDRKGQFRHSQKVMIDETARADWQRLVLEESVEEDGYVAFRLENKSKASVLFDDLTVEHDDTPFVSEKIKYHNDKGAFAARINTNVPDNVIVNVAHSLMDCPTVTNGAIVDNGLNFLSINVTVTAPAPTYGYYGGAIVIVTGSGDISPVYSPAPGSNWGGSSGSSGGNSPQSGGPSSSDNIFVPTGAPKNPTYGTTYVSPYTGQRYVYVGQWVIVLPTVRVQGNPPSNPAPLTTYSFAGVTYTYQYGGWTVPYKGPNNAVDPELVVSPCAAFKRLLAIQEEQRKEIVAIEVEGGKFFILPFAPNGGKSNTEYESFRYDEYKDEMGRTVISIDPEPQGSCNWVLTYYDYSLRPNGPPEITEYPIRGDYHTHPDGSSMDIPSPTDKAFRDNGNTLCGVRKYIVNNNRLVDYTNPNNNTTRTRLPDLCPN